MLIKKGWVLWSCRESASPFRLPKYSRAKKKERRGYDLPNHLKQNLKSWMLTKEKFLKNRGHLHTEFDVDWSRFATWAFAFVLLILAVRSIRKDSGTCPPVPRDLAWSWLLSTVVNKQQMMDEIFNIINEDGFTFEASSRLEAAFSSLVIKYKRNFGDHSITSEPISMTVFSSEVNVLFSSKLSSSGSNLSLTLTRTATCPSEIAHFKLFR